MTVIRCEHADQTRNCSTRFVGSILRTCDGCDHVLYELHGSIRVESGQYVAIPAS